MFVYTSNYRLSTYTFPLLNKDVLLLQIITGGRDVHIVQGLHAAPGPLYVLTYELQSAFKQLFVCFMVMFAACLLC